MSQIVINLIFSIVSSATTRELIEKGLRKLVESTEMFKELNKSFDKVAKKLGIKYEWGGNWKTFVDLPHYQV